MYKVLALYTFPAKFAKATYSLVHFGKFLQTGQTCLKKCNFPENVYKAIYNSHGGLGNFCLKKGAQGYYSLVFFARKSVQKGFISLVNLATCAWKSV